MNEKKTHWISDIVPSELSLVRRGAVRRPWVFIKQDDAEAQVEAEVERRLAERQEQVSKSSDERMNELFARFEKSVGIPWRPGETLIDYCARARLEKAAGRSSRLDELMNESEQRNGGSMSTVEGARVARKVDARALEIKKADTSVTAEQAIVRAYGELSPAEYAALQEHERTSQAELVAKAEAEQPEPYSYPVAVQKAAAAVRGRAGNEGMSIEKATSIALQENPELYGHWQRVDEERAGR